MRLRGPFIPRSRGECCQYAVAHLRRCLARERDRDDLFGQLNRRQQRQIALDEQFGLARSRRRLDDEGQAGLQGALTLRCIAHVTARDGVLMNRSSGPVPCIHEPG